MKKLIVLCVSTLSLFAIMAKPGNIELKNNDGTTFTGEHKGDEWFDWKHTKDNYVVGYNRQSKNYEYMIINENNELELSNVKVRTEVAPTPVGQVGVHRVAAPTQLNLPSHIKKISPNTMGKMWEKAREEALYRQRVK
ncbi:hypothetical protein N9X61_00610 [Sulfurimonas sp.]|nr:hypothetical protein [Sulfurimonas sp.]